MHLDLDAATSIVRNPDPARYKDADILAACAVVLDQVRAGVVRNMAELLRRAVTGGGN